MNEKHTPGPWFCKCYQTSGWTVYNSENADRPICPVYCTNGDYGIDGGPFNDQQCEANARLIAAAPELLEALQRTRQQLVDLHAAIRDQEIEDQFVDDSINMLSEGQTAVAMADAAITRAEKPTP